MYGLPKNIDLNFLQGKTLLQVCFGQHDLNLNFDHGVSIMISSAVGLILPEGNKYRWTDMREGAGYLAALCNNIIESSQGAVDGTITIKFQEGPILEIYDDSEQFESYIVKNGETIIVV